MHFAVVINTPPPPPADGDDEPQRPPSPSVVRGKGEEDGEECAYDGKAKMLVLVRLRWLPPFCATPACFAG